MYIIYIIFYYNNIISENIKYYSDSKSEHRIKKF